MKRIGDRRTGQRFEIVGTLPGTLETWQRFGIRNFAAGGALLETTVPFAASSRINGRLSFGGQSREVRGEVRRLTTLPERGEGLHYLVGITWDPSDRLDEWLSTEPMKPSQSGVRPGAERRSSVRRNAAGGAEIDGRTWSTIELIEISTKGVLFASPMLLEIGEKGQLRVRLGERSFAAQIEVRRSDSRKTSYRLGAAFVSLDDANRLNLEDFIGDARS